MSSFTAPAIGSLLLRPDWPSFCLRSPIQSEEFRKPDDTHFDRLCHIVEHFIGGPHHLELEKTMNSNRNQTMARPGIRPLFISQCVHYK
jgi:hypothetical protein